MNNNFKNIISFSPGQIKVFFGTFIAVFIVVSLQMFGVKAPKLILPFPKSNDIFFDTIIPKVDKIPNSYHLKKKEQIISEAGAAENYENAAAYAVVDYDSGEVLASKNLTKQLSIASLTKIMSAIITLDLSTPKEYFSYTKAASYVTPTKIGGNPGEHLSVRELLHAMLMTSANDAAEIVKDGINSKYHADIFIRAMNEKAQSIGLKGTSFSNPQGYDNQDNYSNAEDVVVLAHYALDNYPLVKDIVKKDYVFLPADEYHKQVDLYNWNGLLGVYPQTIGMKIGNTDSAGYTTVVISEREGKKIIAVVLGAPDIVSRDLWAADLLDLGYKKSMGLAEIKITEEQLSEKYSTWKYW